MISIILAVMIGFGFGDIVDVVESDELASAVDVYQAFDEANREITATEEYYIGRAVAANILATSTPMLNWEPVEYINEIGSVLAGYSPMPFTYGGWHFMILNNNTINALSCPGGIVLLNKGLTDLAENEDELAAIIAHEIAHIALRHGIQSVEKAKMTAAWTTLGHEGAEHLGSDDVRELSDNYGDIVDDITMNLVTKGYSRDSEQQADSLAVHILSKAGYDPMALATILEKMDAQTTTSSEPGFWQTHPAPSDRVSWVEAEIASSSLSSPSAQAITTRTERFTAKYTNAGTETPQVIDRGGSTEGRGESTGRGEDTSTGGRTTTTPEETGGRR